MMINLLDVLCFCTFIVSLLLGVASGSVKLVIGFICFVLSIIASYFIYFILAEALSEYIVSIFIINIISMPLSYTISALFCGIIAKYLKKMVENISAGFFDRIFGAILGTLRGILLSMIVFLLVIIFTGKTYATAENILDIIKPPKEVIYPKWVKSAICFDSMNLLIENTINIIGAKNLQDTKIPIKESNSDSNE